MTEWIGEQHNRIQDALKPVPGILLLFLLMGLVASFFGRKDIVNDIWEKVGWILLGCQILGGLMFGLFVLTFAPFVLALILFLLLQLALLPYRLAKALDPNYILKRALLIVGLVFAIAGTVILALDASAKK